MKSDSARKHFQQTFPSADCKHSKTPFERSLLTQMIPQEPKQEQDKKLAGWLHGWLHQPDQVVPVEKPGRQNRERLFLHHGQIGVTVGYFN